MTKLNLAELRPQLDLETKYVDFSILRTSLSVVTVVSDLETNLSAATKEGERRGCCPKCRKERAFALNVNTNRFNCFAKGCVLKGGGVIDLIAKLFEVPAKEASHLLACAYGIQPYSPVQVSQTQPPNPEPEKSPAAAATRPGQNGEVVSREEFDALQSKVEQLSLLFWSQLYDDGLIDKPAELFDEQPDYELKAALSV